MKIRNSIAVIAVFLSLGPTLFAHTFNTDPRSTEIDTYIIDKKSDKFDNERASTPIDPFAPTQCDINFEATPLGTIDNQNFGTTVPIEDGYGISMNGNLWKTLPFNQNILPGTILEFEFKATSQGEEHGIGFSNGTAYPNGTRFKVHGTQAIPANLANNSFKYNGSGEYQTFSIPIGQFISGNFQNIVFVSDNDAPQTSSISSFKNVRVIQPNQICTPRDTITRPECAINFDNASISSILGQDAGITSINENNFGITVTNNGWKAIRMPRAINSGTKLRFEFRASKQGEEHAIGFANTLVGSQSVDGKRFKLFGTQAIPKANAYQNFTYNASGEWQSFEIPVAQFFTGEFEYMVFIMDNDAIATIGDSNFRNVELVDSTEKCVKEMVVGVPDTSCEINFAGANSSNIIGQGEGVAAINENNLGISITNNVWKTFEISNSIERETRIEFEFKSTVQGEEHAIGFTNDPDNPKAVDGKRFKLYGNQKIPLTLAFQDFKYTKPGEWQSFSIPIGQFFTGDFKHIVFLMDNDAKPTTGDTNFRKVRVLNPDGSCQDHVINEGSTTSNPPSINYMFNFGPEGTVSPVGWITETGAAFGRKQNGITYGWSLASNKTPTDFSGQARNRNPNPDFDVVRETLVHFNRAGTSPKGIWEVEVPNGEYEVTLQVGDIDAEITANTKHSVKAEEIVLADYEPQGGSGTRTFTNIIRVTDGRLTLDASQGLNAKINAVAVQSTDGLRFPVVLGSVPKDGATNVSLTTSISGNFLFLPNISSTGSSGIDNSTITSQTVKLYAVRNGSPVEVSVSVNGTGGGDAINLSAPNSTLEANTRYIFRFNGVKDLAGVELFPFTSEFTTGAEAPPVVTGGNLDEVSFSRFGNVATGSYTTLVIGPDNKLYGMAFGGEIHRWEIKTDGSLANKQILKGLTNARGARLAIALTFAPNATANNLVAYVTHASNVFSNALDFDGNLSKLTGPNLETERLLISGLPRSVRDHLTNSIAFKGNNSDILYFQQGSNSAGGEPDGPWGNRDETLLTAATLRLDLTKLPTNATLNVRTSQTQSVINSANSNSATFSDGSYNPYFTNAPLTIYASGIRNAYDLVWHTNGQLYVPTNGTAGGANVPASVQGTRKVDGTFYSGPTVPKLELVSTQRDWLFRVDPSKPVGYFGHPNPKRGEYVMNRGPLDVSKYASTIKPDANYRGSAFDFEFNKSPNGVIEYKTEGALKGALLVCRYSGGSDLIALIPDGPNGDIGKFKIGIPGFTGFEDPLDLIEDVRNGNIYVSDLKTQNIVLLKPQNLGNQASSLSLTATPSELIFDGPRNTTLAVQNIIVKNISASPIVINSMSLNGAAAGQYAIKNASALPITLAAGASTTIGIEYKTGGTVGNFNGQLVLDQGNGKTLQVGLYGLTAKGLGGSNEPPLQNIVRAAGYSIDVGGTSLLLPTSASAIGDETIQSTFTQASSGPITIKPIARYSPPESLAFGTYEAGLSTTKRQLLTLQTASTENQTLFPAIGSGSLTFEADKPSFGFYITRNGIVNIHSEDNLNTSNVITHGMRIYPLKDRSGVLIENAYLFAIEEVDNGDYNDYVFAVFNIRPSGSIGNNKLPAVSFAQPEDGDVFAIGEGVAVTAIASDEDGSIASVELFVNGASVGKDTQIPYEWNSSTNNALKNLTAGSYQLRAVAKDNLGGASEQKIVVTVGNANSGARISVENQAKVFGANRSFPAKDYIAFLQVGTPKDRIISNFGKLKISNPGSAPLTINKILISSSDFILPNGEALKTLTIAPGSSLELLIQFVKKTGVKGVYKATLELFSNDPSKPKTTVTLAGGYMVRLETTNELDPFQVYNELFNFKSILDADGIFASAYPTQQSILSGEQGDLVVSRLWEQADPSKPVGVTYLSALKGPGGANFKMTNTSGAVVGGVSLTFGATWNQSIFPRKGTNDSKTPLYGISVNSISEKFLMSIDGRGTGGSNGTNPQTGTGIDLKYRVYRVIDGGGNTIPNEYFAIMDYSTSPCTTKAGGECDYNDNGVYLTNIRPTQSTTAIKDGVASKSESTWQVYLYPNPSKDKIFIDAKNIADHALEISIWDMNGRMVISKKYDERHKDILEVDLVGVSAGQYILNIASLGSKVYSSHIVVE